MVRGQVWWWVAFVRGAGKPIVGASVQLYGAGMTGARAGAAALGAAVTTDGTGTFTVPAGYSCASSATELYVVARGGSATGASENAALAEITVLGACGAVSAATSYGVT